MSTLGVLAATVEDGCLIKVLAAGSSSFFVIYSAFIHLEIFKVHFDCAGAESGGLARVLIFGLGDDCSWQAPGKPR